MYMTQIADAAKYPKTAIGMRGEIPHAMKAMVVVNDVLKTSN